MRKMKFLAAVIITIIACFAFPMAVGAAPVSWNDACQGATLNVDDYIVISNDSSGMFTYSGDTLYISAEADNLADDIILNLDGVEFVSWSGDINTSSGSVTIQGTVDKTERDYEILLTSVEIISSNPNAPALTINAGNADVVLNHCKIETINSIAVVLNSPTILEASFIPSGWNEGIKSTNNTAIYTTANLEVQDANVTGFNGIVSTGINSVLTIDSNLAVIQSTGGTNNAGAQHAISVEGTAYLTQGRISTDSTSTSHNDSAVYTQNGNIIIHGSTYVHEITGGTDQNGIEIDGTGTLVMSEGNVSGYNGIYVKNTNGVAISGGSISGRTGVRIEGAAGNGVVISGGTITATTAFDAGVVISGNNNRTSSTIIRGTAVIDGGSTNGVVVGNGNASLLIENGTFSGSSAALTSNGFNSLKITGGNFSSASWNAINLSVTKTIVIQPTVSTPVTLQGGNGAINLSGGGSVSIDASSYYTSTNYDGAGKTFYIQGLAPYVNSNSYKYAQFLATAPSFNVTVNGGTANGYSSANIQAGTVVTVIPTVPSDKLFVEWTVTGVSLTDPLDSTQQFTMPLHDVTFTAVFEDVIYEPAERILAVTFISNGGTEVPEQMVESGETATLPTTPTREGYAFAGWYTDDETFTNSYDFSTPVTESIVLYANWKVVISGPSYNPGPSYTPTPTPAEEPKPEPETDTDPSAGKKDCLIVIATLNKSGSVNSKATAEDIAVAHTTAVRDGYGRMFLKIPEGGTAISASTMKKLYTAAGGTDIYLIFDFYDTYEVDESDVYGKFLLKLNDKTGQILTGLDFDTTRIQTAQNYIENRWDTEILASYETKQKSPWGDTATFKISIDRLGFKANDGEKLYALIYDTKENKWYQTSATIEDGNVIVKTKRAGIITIVTDSVK